MSGGLRVATVLHRRIESAIEVIEIDVGGRYSYERKSLPFVYDGGGLSTGVIPGTTFLGGPSTIIHPVVSRAHWNDFSPEVTASYRPNRNLTVFASYKKGFLSGGFNSSSVNFRIPGVDISYNPEKVKGFEGGVKASLLDGALRVNTAIYTYKVKDLQVTNFVNATASIRNAGAVKIYGAEGDFTYQAPIEGLTVHGAAAYNHGKYTSFPAAPCYNGQTPAQGCHIVNGNPIQNLGGTELIRAPKWNLSGGANFETPVGATMKAGVSLDATYSSSYLTDASSAPQGRQPSYTLLDATLRIGAPNDSWQLALVGRNLLNKYYFVASPNVPFTGSGTGTAAGVLGDRFASVSRGREIMIRASYRFGQ